MRFIGIYQLSNRNMFDRPSKLPKAGKRTVYTKLRERVVHAPDDRMPEPSGQRSKTNDNSVRIANGSFPVLAPVSTAVVAGTVAEGSPLSGRAHVESEDLSKTYRGDSSTLKTTISLRQHWSKSKKTEVRLLVEPV